MSISITPAHHVEQVSGHRTFKALMNTGWNDLLVELYGYLHDGLSIWPAVDMLQVSTQRCQHCYHCSAISGHSAGVCIKVPILHFHCITFNGHLVQVFIWGHQHFVIIARPSVDILLTCAWRCPHTVTIARPSKGIIQVWHESVHTVLPLHDCLWTSYWDMHEGAYAVLLLYDYQQTSCRWVHEVICAVFFYYSITQNHQKQINAFLTVQVMAGQPAYCWKLWTWSQLSYIIISYGLAL